MIRHLSLRQNIISFNEVARRQLEFRKQSRKKSCTTLRGIDIYRLLAPYISSRFIAQIKVVLPLAVYLILFQTLVLNQMINEPVKILLGLAAVVLGLMLFMEGLSKGLMPFGETIGHNLPAKVSLPTVLLIAFLKV